MKPAHIPALLMLVLIVAALSGCTGPERKITATVGPTATPEPTLEPTPAPTAVRPIVTATDGMTVVKGNKDGQAKEFRLNEGVYVVTWAGTGTYLSFSLNDLNGNGPTDFSKGRTTGKKLLVVDGTSLYAGGFNLAAASDSDWSVTIERPDTSSPASLPVTASGSDEEGAVSAPFRAHSGDMKVSYTFSRIPYADGHVYIYNVATGESFYTRPLSSGTQVGQSMAMVPSDGVYIAQVNMPPGSAYGDITISQ
jgi:WD40 repeat protein